MVSLYKGQSLQCIIQLSVPLVEAAVPPTEFHVLCSQGSVLLLEEHHVMLCLLLHVALHFLPQYPVTAPGVLELAVERLQWAGLVVDEEVSSLHLPLTAPVGAGEDDLRALIVVEVDGRVWDCEATVRALLRSILAHPRVLFKVSAHELAVAQLEGALHDDIFAAFGRGRRKMQMHCKGFSLTPPHAPISKVDTPHKHFVDLSFQRLVENVDKVFLRTVWTGLLWSCL